MTARFRALRHDGIDSGVHSLACLFQRLNLNDKPCFPGTDAGEERTKISEREHQRGGSTIKGEIEQMRLAGQ